MSLSTKSQCPHDVHPDYCTDSVCETVKRFKMYAENAGLTPQQFADMIDRMTPEQIKEAMAKKKASEAEKGTVKHG